MTFLALLTKELRLRLRRERIIWVIIVYILLMGLLGWFFIGNFSSTNSSGLFSLSDTGVNLYGLLSMVQLFLILFITPAFTAGAINSEKELQTFDLLLCSRLSSFSLVAGKLVAGLLNALLLIAASAPLFSLVFFFGGVSPDQVLSALIVYVVTTLMIGAFALFCSTIMARPAVSTATAYMGGIIWLILSLLIYYTLLAASAGNQNIRPAPFLIAWNPVVALLSTYPSGTVYYYTFGNTHVAVWVAYTLLNILLAALFFGTSMLTVKPNFSMRLAARGKKATLTA